jgi:hypothetical protein
MNLVLAANDAFFQAIIEKRVADICASYVPSEETYVILEGPRYTTLGYEKIAKGWADFCQSPLSLRSIEGWKVLFAKQKVQWLGLAV